MPKRIAKQGPFGKSQARKRKQSQPISSISRPDVGVIKKDQQPDAIHDAEAVDQPEDNYFDVSQDIASPQGVAQVPLLQNLSKSPTHGKSVSWDEHGSAGEEEGNNVPFDKEASSEMRGIKNSH